MSIKLNGATNGSVELDVPDAIGSDLSVTIPATAGELTVKATDGSVDLGAIDIAASAPADSVNIDSSGRLLVGTSSSVVINNNDTSLQVVGTTTGTSRVAFIRQSNDGGGAGIHIGKARGTSNQIVQDNDQIGIIAFNAADGTDFATQTATIQCLVDNTPGANDMPGRLVFSTTADGASSPTERLKIDRDGLLYSVPTYDNTTGSTTNYMRIGANGEMYRSTSSIAYKTDVEDMGDTYADAILNLRPVWYRSTCESDNPNHSHWGFIAEEVEQVDPRLCSFRDVEIAYNEEGKQVVTPLDTPVVDGVDYAALTPLLLNLIKRQKEQIEAMEARLTTLEGGAS